jgi:hypothetical protein
MRYLLPLNSVSASSPMMRDYWFETAITKSFFNDALNRMVVFNDHNP